MIALTVASVIVVAGCGVAPPPPTATASAIVDASDPATSSGEVPTAAAGASKATSPGDALTPSIASIDPLSVFMPDRTVGTMLSADGAVWAFDWSGVLRIDPATDEARRFGLDAADGSDRPSVFGAIGFGSIWVGDFERDEVRRFDEATGAFTTTIATTKPEGLLVDGTSVWVADHRTGSVSRIDPVTNRVVATVEVGEDGRRGPERLAASGGKIWTGIPNALAVAGIDPTTNTAAGTIVVAPPGNPCGDIGVYGDRLFVSGCSLAEALAVVDVKAGVAVASPEFNGAVTAPVTVGDHLWLGIGRGADGDLTRMDPSSLEVGPGVPVTGGSPTVLLAASDSMWVAVEQEDSGRAWILRLPLAAFQ
jgi:YVTN family beta-propeller protein